MEPPYEVLTVDIEGQRRRGAKITCGRAGCGIINTLPANTFRVGAMHGEDVELRHLTRKFEKLGWKVGKQAKDNRCPGCFSAIKIAATRRRREAMRAEATRETLMTTASKIVPINTHANGNGNCPPPSAIVEQRPISPEERRIIFRKMDEVYSERVGYLAGWNDARLASDLGVPCTWVSQLRNENFGPEVDVQTIAEAKSLLNELRAAGVTVEPIVRMLRGLTGRGERIQKMLEAIAK